MPETANDVKPPTHVRWHCRRCAENGTLPSLDGLERSVLLDAIARGHERRAPMCHAKHGTKWVFVGHGNMQIRFASWDAREAAP